MPTENRTMTKHRCLAAGLTLLLLGCSRAAHGGPAAGLTNDNTIVALERSGALLTRVSRVFNALTAANTNDTLQRVQTEEAPRLAAHTDAIYLNAALFRRGKSVYDRRASLGPDSVQQFLIQRYYRDFVRAGAPP